MEVRELTYRRAVTCTPETTLAAAAEQMLGHTVGCLLVVEDAGRLVGIVTDRDAVVRALARGLGPDAVVETVMTRDVCCVQESADVFAAADLMAQRVCRRLPVVGEDGSVKGVIALDDLVVVFADQLEKLARTVRREIAPALSW